MIYNASPGSTIPLGYLGENLVEAVVFDRACWLQEYGPGTFELVHKRSHDSAPQPVVLSVSGGAVTWTLTEADTAYRGVGEAQLLFYTPDGKLKKSEIYQTVTARSLTSPESPPEPIEGWVEQVLAAAAGIQNMQVESDTLTPGSPATVVKTVDPDTGVVTLTFGIPEGIQGVSVSSVEVLPSGELRFYFSDGTTQTVGRDVYSAMEALLTLTQEAQAAAETAQDKAEDAQTAAETAQEKAEDAQTAAETAQDKAEDAQGAAETAQTAAETAQEKAEDAQGAAETAQTAAETAQEAAAASASAASGSASAASGAASDAASSAASVAASAAQIETNKTDIGNLKNAVTGASVKTIALKTSETYPLGFRSGTFIPETGQSSTSGNYSRSIAPLDLGLYTRITIQNNSSQEIWVHAFSEPPSFTNNADNSEIYNAEKSHAGIAGETYTFDADPNYLYYVSLHVKFTSLAEGDIPGVSAEPIAYELNALAAAVEAKGLTVVDGVLCAKFLEG